MSYKQTHDGVAYLLVVCCLFCLLRTTCAESQIISIPFSGGAPVCPDYNCPAGKYCMASFLCDTSPNWQDGIATFMDPMGPGSTISMIAVTVIGLFGCGQYNSSAAHPVHIYFAGTRLGDVEVITATNCTCQNCASMSPFTLYVSNWEGYKFGADNTIQVYGDKLSTCLSSIDIVLKYTPGNVPYTTSSTTTTSSTSTSTLTSSTTATTSNHTEHNTTTGQHNIVVVGAVMLSGMVFVNMCVVGGWYALKKKPENEDAESGVGKDTGPLLDKQLHYKDIMMGERIGRGSFGEVYLATWFSTRVAVKKLPLEMLRQNTNVLEEFSREINLLRSLRHPNILQFLGSCSIPPNICLVTEFLPRGDLHKIIHDKTVNMDKALMKSILLDVSRGMNYLHSSNPVVIHRDLKSHNVLIGEHWQGKVADFGLCKIIQSWEETSKYTPCGTPKWAAPEVLRNETYTTKADVYSFAIILWEITTRLDPFPGMSAFELIIQVGKHGLRPGQIEPDNPLASLIVDCWDDNPKQRPSFERILTILEAW